ncbi:MAG: hypothetical protein ACYC61_17940 [Isosphaeraceae bacterium]
MSSQRGRRGRIGSRFLATSFAIGLLATVSGSAMAQPGFGPDPFWPYNSQYTPYARPVGPAGPMAGGRMGGPPVAIQGANQFQDYLDNMQGSAGRNFSDRATIGTPYYRSAVSPDFDPRGRGFGRQYQPNSGDANANYDVAQRRAAEKYFAYYSERDPARRRELMKEYRDARRDASQALNSRVRIPGTLEPSRGGTGARGTDRMGARGGAGLGAGGRSTAGGRSAAVRSSRIGPAPAIDSSPSGPARRRNSNPSAVLERSQAMDRYFSGGNPPASRPPGTRSGAVPRAVAPRSNPTSPRTDSP